MSKFFDIFENVDNNLEIENYISLYHETNNPDILSVLDLLLSYDSDKIAKRYYDYPEAKNSGINLRAAIDYATRYAVNQNGAILLLEWSIIGLIFDEVSQILNSRSVQEYILVISFRMKLSSDTSKNIRQIYGSRLYLYFLMEYIYV